MKALEPEQSMLRDIKSKDWAVRVHKSVSTRVVSVKSLKWPGAACCLKSGTQNFSNIYVGYGHERTNNSFYPVAPPEVQDEPEDVAEQPEPVAKPAEEAPPADA